ncbi:MAG: arsenic resistance N-acetyltransferase ArsN2 [Polyangiales bacterium]
MSEAVTVSPAIDADRASVVALLEECGLPTSDIDELFPSAFVVAREGGALVGVAAVELHGADALLRSVAVRRSARSRGVARRLVDDRLRSARSQGARTVALLTTSAAPFFERLGFRRQNRDDLSDEICRSSQFTSVCPASATCMTLQLSKDDTMNETKNDEIRSTVREQYAKVANATEASCCAPGCCGPNFDVSNAEKLGYSAEDIAALPDGANMGLGCGNPAVIAALREGETVLDLGAGGGIDCFLASKKVGAKGKVIGVDMTPAMVTKARSNAAKGGYGNVDFRLGEIEHLPVADNSVDVILSNCVVNLSPDKDAVFREAFRVLNDGGRLAISDIVLLAPLPETLKSSVDALTGCVSGAIEVAAIERSLRAAGFSSVDVAVKEESREFIKDWLPGSGAENFVASAAITATKGTPRVEPAKVQKQKVALGTKPEACCAPGCCDPKE